MSDPEEFTTQPDELQRVLIQLQLLRNADAPLRRGPNWLSARRLAVYARCCQDREPLVEVMNTDPACVLLGQAAVGQSAIAKFEDVDTDRRRWQGVVDARGDQGIVWLSTFERMAECGGKQWLWCRDQRWWIDPADVVSLRGEHTDVLHTDITGRMR